MKRILLFAVSILALPGINAYANTVSFSESLADRVVALRQDGETSFEVIRTGAFSARGKVVFSSPDDFTVAPDTTVSITLGEYSFEATLGDDPKFTSRSKSVSFPVFSSEDKKIGAVTIAWSRTAVTCSIAFKTGSNPNGLGEEFEASPVAAGLITGENTTITRNDEMDTECTFTVNGGEIGASAQMRTTGSAKVATRTVGRGDFAQEFEINTVTAKGAGPLIVE